ncbi:hypothetical protein ACWPKO_21530 (plasmid) [Coraliomargarita sp. W4R53]
MDRSRNRWWPSVTALSALCIIGFSVSASILILFIPSLFQSGAEVHPLVVAGLVALSVTFAVGARCWRPEAPVHDLR